MTTTDRDIEEQAKLFESNVAKLDELNQRLVAVLKTKKQVDPSLSGPGQDLFLKTTAAYWQDAIQNPGKLIEQQISYWGKSLTYFAQVQQAVATGQAIPSESSEPFDKRFANPLWQSHPYFKFIKQQYLHNAEAVMKAVEAVEGFGENRKKAA